MPMVRAHTGTRGRFCKLGHLAIQLGFANSIGAFCKTVESSGIIEGKRLT